MNTGAHLRFAPGRRQIGKKRGIRSGGNPVRLTKWNAGDRPINHTIDNHNFFVGNGDLPLSYRFDVLSGKREFVRQVTPADTTGVERITQSLMTPDGKYYVYSGTRRLSALLLVSGLQWRAPSSSPGHSAFLNRS